MEDHKNGASVQSIDRAFQILETLAECPQGLAIAALSTRLGLNKATVHRILQTLVQWGYVSKDDQHHYYRLGMKVVALSSSYLNGLELKTEALPFMEQLRQQTGLFVHLGILDGRDVVYLEKLGPFTHLRMYSQIGRRATLYSTSLGKAMFARLDAREQSALLAQIQFLPVTDKTIQSADRFLEEAAVTLRRGFALDDEENETGMRCVGAAILDYTGRVIAAVSVSGHISSFPPEKVQAFGAYAAACASAISAQMGYRPRDGMQL